MVLGIISCLLGAIIFLINLFLNTSGAPQQIIQYLGYVCASIFVASGLIMINSKIIPQDKKNEYKRAYPDLMDFRKDRAGNIKRFNDSGDTIKDD